MPRTTDADPIRIALIGCGMIARLHAQRLISDGRARIAALFDVDGNAARRLQLELAPDAVVFDRLETLLDAGASDAAVICTPTLFHFEQIQACHARQLPVLCEKPLADTRDRIQSLVASERAGAPILSVSYQRRYDPIYRTMRREVQSGRWGPVQSVTSHNAERWQQSIAGTWRDDPALNPGGFLGDAGSHKIDMLFFVTGLEPIEVAAHSDRRGSHVEIVTTVSGRLRGGAALSMNFIGDAQHWREDFQIHCADADLLIRDNQLWMGRHNRVEPITELLPGSSPDRAFLDILRAGAANLAPPACALAVFDFTRAVLDSAHSNKPVRLDSI